MTAAAPFHRPRLLVIDDQPANIRALHALFRDQCEVFMVTDSREALARCHAMQPDLILLDVVMPGLDGHEVCRLLKADPATQDIPVIFITSQLDEADEMLGFELGAVDFIRKPINPVITRARVQTHLVLKRQADLLRTIALVDGLTGVANRRRFDEALQVHWRQCRREQQPLSLVLLDVDYFKRFNDCYGHPAGDRCLAAVAGAVRGCLQRPLDLVARYGGEEFACILPQTPLPEAEKRAGEMLAAVRALAIEHRDSDVAPVVTISLGVACMLPATVGTPETLVEMADACLYRAKRRGRARVEAGVEE